MLKVILQEPKLVHPFNEPARDLRLLNKPLWLHQRDVLTPHVTREIEIGHGKPLPDDKEECIVYRDNLFFDALFIDHFIQQAKKRNRPCRAAFSIKESAFREHALPLSTSRRAALAAAPPASRPPVQGGRHRGRCASRAGAARRPGAAETDSCPG